jgi:predicted nucleic acid-binding Zn ribbon protein
MPVITELPGVEEGEVAAVPAAEEPPAPDQDPGAEAPLCPICGAKVLPDEAFCSNCGASLAKAPIPPEPVAAPEVEPVPEAEAEAAPEPEAEAEAPPAPPEPEVEEAPPPPEPEAPPVEAPAPPAEPVGLNCPACGAEIEPGDLFCSACGLSLQAPPVPAPAAAPEPAVTPALTAAAGPRLVISASGAEIPLPVKDEIIVGREDPVSGIYPDVDLTPHGGESGGVSRRHARILIDGGEYYVEDLDSTNFTFVNKQKLAPKTRQLIRQGDEIRFGRVASVLQIA